MMFQNKVAVVTGSGGGIGREIALMLAARGAKIVVNDLGSSVIGEGASSEPANETVRMIREAGGEAVANTDSVASWQGGEQIIQTALDHFGRIDVVVNNAGNVRFAPFWEITEEAYRSIVATHLDGAFFVSRAAAPHFKAQNGGVFVQTTSTSGLMGHYNQGHYCAAKAGIVGLSRAIALDMKAFGVRSNCVAPFANSRMADGAIRSPEHQKMVSAMKPVQNARLVVALASDQTSDVNGQAFITRGNEIFLAGQGFPVKSVHDGNEWTPENIISHALPTLRSGFTPMVGFGEYFSWDII